MKIAVLGMFNNNTSVDMLSKNIYAELMVLSKVYKFEVVKCQYDDYAGVIADKVVYIAYYDKGANLRDIKNTVSAKHIVTARETIFSRSDFSFTWNVMSSNGKCKLIPPPFDYKIIKQYQKIKGTAILLDHCWPPYGGDSRDMSSKISKWSKELTYSPIYKFVTHNEDLTYLLPHETIFYGDEYYKYLEQIYNYGIKTFVVTHKESYGYGVLDMIAMGVWVVAPENFLPQSIVEYFKIKTFSTKDEYFNAVNNIDYELVQDNRCKFTDYKDLAYMIYNKLIELR